MMGNLGHSTCVDADEIEEQAVWGESMLLLDSLSEMLVVSTD